MVVFRQTVVVVYISLINKQIECLENYYLFTKNEY